MQFGRGGTVGSAGPPWLEVLLGRVLAAPELFLFASKNTSPEKAVSLRATKAWQGRAAGAPGQAGTERSSSFLLGCYPGKTWMWAATRGLVFSLSLVQLLEGRVRKG